MINVKIRHIDSYKPVQVCQCEIAEVEEVISRISFRGGVYCNDDVCDEISGQFVLHGSEFYFEIVIS